MSTGLKVFLIYPAKIIVYNIEDPETNNAYVFNAGNLEHLKNPHIADHKEVEGFALSTFEVKPVVLGYKNGTFEIVYVPPGKKTILKSDGSIAQPNRSPVILYSVIEVPVLSTFPQLKATNLANPDETILKQYIQASQTNNVSNKPTVLPSSSPRLNPSTINNSKLAISPVISMSQITPPVKALDDGVQDIPSESPKSGFKSPSPRLGKCKSQQQHDENTAELKNEAMLMRQEINELRSQLTALCRRIYQLYPVEIPDRLKFNGVEHPIISVDDLQKKITNGEITQTIMEPLYQAFAGSHRSNIRLLTCIDKNGKVYHVRAAYDPKENRISLPKTG